MKMENSPALSRCVLLNRRGEDRVIKCDEVKKNVTAENVTVIVVFGR